MKFTIVTPSYNQGVFIGRCLASIRNQVGDFQVQHIILDNCSTDETGRELEAYADAPGSVDVSLIVERDQGQTSAINHGFSLAQGDVVSWLNTDEWLSDDALARVAEFFERSPDVDVVFGNCDFVDSSGKVVRQKREFGFSRSMLVHYGCFLPSCSTFVRRRVLDSGLLLDPGFKVTMDFDWYVRIANAGYKFAHLPISLASFTWHETNISSTLKARRIEERKLVQERHGGVRGPKWFRAAVHGAMRRYWQGRRVLRRLRAG